MSNNTKQGWNDVHKSIGKKSWNDVHKSIGKQDPNNKIKRTTNCRDCDGLVSKSAKQCPHCGASKPYESVIAYEITVVLKFILFVFLIAVLILSIFILSAGWGYFEEQRELQMKLHELFRYESLR